ncbi:kinesin [Thraustotheca clavata]|uniref:Kinesin n=1 Tax=Thraustotheca clavata TaxID=74557 RepID=A0A1V9ZY29_9STRA|nr:kinesin [Thraustotheca clavata]
MRAFAFLTGAIVALQAAAMPSFDDNAAQAALEVAETWVGKHLYASAVEATGDTSAILECEITYEPHRIIRGRSYTEELMFGRLNVQIDENKVITRLKMVPEKQWRDKGDMMDKRTARKVHGVDFKSTIKSIREQLVGSNQDEQSIAPTEGIQVYIRKRPLLEHEAKKKEFDVVTCVGEHCVVVHDCQMYADMKRKFIENHRHEFSHVFNEAASTDSVFDCVGVPLIKHAMSGGKSVIMMYGQTGSGKTHTMAGFQQRLVEMLFSSSSASFDVVVSAVEIAGSKCYDLLRKRQRVIVCDDANGDSKLLNVTKHIANSAIDVLQVVQKALAQRATEKTAVNSVSSRSHFLCFINLQSNNKNDVPASKQGIITLMDLAGSERNEDSFQHTADRRRETIEINSSHMALKQCVRALGQEDISGYVPYRASTLTRLLKDSLWSKDAKAAVIATISPICTDTEHTLHTLQYAKLMLEENPELVKDRVEVTVAIQEKSSKIAIKDWSHDQVIAWMQSLKRGAFSKYASNIVSAIDGKQVSRFGLPRWIQICNNNHIDAEAVFNAMRKELGLQEKIEKERRARNVTRMK